jgi:CRP/FNR family cyclic AMP-dependent transcriptional regulator
LRPEGTGRGAGQAVAMNSTEPEDTLNDQLLQAMADRGGVKSFPANAVLVNEDDDSDSIFIVLKGKVKVYGAGANGREVVYTTLGPGEYFGEMTLDGGPRSASVMTLEPVTCVVVTGANVRDFLGTHPDFALHLVRKLIALVRRSTDTVKRLALDDVYTRISKLLYELAQEDAAGHLVVTDRLTQQDIADRVGSSREMVSRIFKQLTIGGYVATEGKRIVLLKKLPARW